MMAAPVAPQTVTAPAPSSEADVYVIGNRLKKVRLELKVVGNELSRCRIAVSSGDPFIDNEACKAADECIARGIRQTDPLLTCMNDHVVAAVKLDQIRHMKKNDAPN